MSTLSAIISSIKHKHVIDTEVPLVKIHRFEEEEKPFIFSTNTAEQVTAHVVDGRYARCPGEVCPLCKSGKKRFLPSNLLLFPAYSLLDEEMGVVRCTEKIYPGSLLSQIVPVLDSGVATIVWISQESKKHHLRLENLPDDGVAEALSALDDFERDVKSGVIDLKHAVPSISSAELQAAVSGVSRWVR